MLIDQVRTFCLAQQLFTPGPVLVAVSGGADSLTLLHVLKMLSTELQITLHVATFDHQIRGAESAADVQFVREVATAWQIPVISGAADVPQLAQDWKMGLEAAARRARYAFLARTAHRLGAQHIATGHHRDDQAETVLLHLIRGAGLAGLRGMAPKTVLVDSDSRTPLTIVRPLLDTPRAAIDEYIRKLGLQPRIDTSNNDVMYTRNKIRHEVLPLLESINPQVRLALSRTATLVSADYDALYHTLPTLDNWSIKRDQFLVLWPAQRRLLMRDTAQRIAPEIEISFERIEAAIAFIANNGHGKLRLSGSVWLRLSRQTITFYDQLAYAPGCPWLPPPSQLRLVVPGALSLPEDWRLTVEALPPDAVNNLKTDDPLTVTLEVSPGAVIELRTPHPGDRFRPYGMNGHSQKLSDTFINAKVRADWRERLPLLLIDGEIAWVILPTGNGPQSRIADPFAVYSRPDYQRWRFNYDRNKQ